MIYCSDLQLKWIRYIIYTYGGVDSQKRPFSPESRSEAMYTRTCDIYPNEKGYPSMMGKAHKTVPFLDGYFQLVSLGCVTHGRRMEIPNAYIVSCLGIGS